MKLVVALVLFQYALAQINMDCALLLPAQPLTPAGLATPYQLQALNAAAGPCNQKTDGQTSFVQGVVYDNSVQPPNIFAYNPIVVDAGTTPLVALVAPVLNQGAQIGLWFGTNANTLTLMDGGNGGFNAGQCVNGLVQGAVTSIFGQFSYCNAQNFFIVALADLKARVLVPPPLGTARDGLPCPTTNDFFVVDQDPNDNVVTAYLVSNANGRVALNNTANLMQFQATATLFVNPSDERLIGAINAAIGCPGWRIRDFNDPQNVAGVLTVGSNELFAAAYQGTVPGMSPIANIPLNDPMAQVGNQPSLAKVNLYRAGVGQPPALTPADADVVAFCRNLLYYQPQRMLKNINALYSAPSPTPAVATSLLGFLANRFVAAFGAGNLGCTNLLRVPQPMNLTVNANGQVTGASITPYYPPGVGASSAAVIKKNSAVSVSFNLLLLISMVLLALVRM